MMSYMDGILKLISKNSENVFIFCLLSKNQSPQDCSGATGTKALEVVVARVVVVNVVVVVVVIVVVVVVVEVLVGMIGVLEVEKGVLMSISGVGSVPSGSDVVLEKGSGRYYLVLNLFVTRLFSVILSAFSTCRTIVLSESSFV